jgi:hypothetical protein
MFSTGILYVFRTYLSARPSLESLEVYTPAQIDTLAGHAGQQLLSSLVSASD